MCVFFCQQPQNEYIEQFRKRHGYRLDHFEKRYAVKYTLSGSVFISSHSHQTEEVGSRASHKIGICEEVTWDKVSLYIVTNMM